MALMNHLHDGTLRALLDGELAGGEREAALEHLGGCAQCNLALEEARTVGATVSQALRALDAPAELDRARAALRRRLAERSGRRARLGAGPRWRTLPFQVAGVPLARAAGVVLLLTGVVASAVPGSPVREWVAAGWERAVRALGGDGGKSAAPLPAAVSPERPEAGVRVAPAGGRLRVLLIGVPAGAEIRVQLTDEGVAGVYAGGGSRFRTAPGLMEAMVTGPNVRIEIPRGVPQASLEVDGRPFLRKIGERLELLGPERDSAGAEIRFRVPPESGRKRP